MTSISVGKALGWNRCINGLSCRGYQNWTANLFSNELKTHQSFMYMGSPCAIQPVVFYIFKCLLKLACHYHISHWPDRKAVHVIMLSLYWAPLLTQSVRLNWYLHDSSNQCHLCAWSVVTLCVVPQPSFSICLEFWPGRVQLSRPVCVAIHSHGQTSIHTFLICHH